MRGKRNWSCIALLYLCLAFPFAAAADDAQNKSFSNMFVFGDSLSDTGNLAAFRDLQFGRVDVPLPEVFPIGLCNQFDIFVTRDGCADLFFRQSRVTNGPVAVEILAERLGFDGSKPSLFFLSELGFPPSGTNYAVAGAEAAEFGRGDFNTQIVAFLDDLVFFPEPSKALYVIIIGGNDIISAVKAAADLLKGVDLAPEERPKAIIDAAINAIGDRIGDLIRVAGAQNFLVANSANIGSIPATRIRADEQGLSRALVIGSATLLTKKFNKQLAQRLDQIRTEQQLIGNPIEIKEFNLFLFFEQVRLVGKVFFGLNIVDNCFNSDTYAESPTAQRIFHPDCAPDPDPGELPKFDRFVFFDAIHPTGQVHRIIGKALSKAARKLIDD